MNKESITMLFYRKKGADNGWRFFYCPKYSVRFGQESLSVLHKNNIKTG
jgi:hypothetical protein